MDKNEKDLVEEFVNGSEQAYNLIARKYQKNIYWHALRMLGTHDDADDLTQEVLIVLYKKLHTFKFNSALSTWIYRITSTRAINYLRKKKIRAILRLGDVSESEQASSSDIISNIEDKERIASINKILQKLPVRQREVFILRNFNEMTYEEISEILGVSTGSLKASYFHAQKKIVELSNE